MTLISFQFNARAGEHFPLQNKRHRKAFAGVQGEDNVFQNYTGYITFALIM
jgi:hypothetical protein